MEISWTKIGFLYSIYSVHFGLKIYKITYNRLLWKQKLISNNKKENPSESNNRTHLSETDFLTIRQHRKKNKRFEGLHLHKSINPIPQRTWKFAIEIQIPFFAFLYFLFGRPYNVWFKIALLDGKSYCSTTEKRKQE